MKKFFYRTLILLILIAIIGAILYFQNVVKPSHVREHYNHDAQEIRIDKKERSKEKEGLAPTQYQKEKKVQIFDHKLTTLNTKLNQLEEKVKVRETYCLKVLNETIEDDDYIDINDEMYNDLDLVKYKFTKVLDEAMSRPEADELYSTIYKTVESNPKIDPRILFSRLERIDICRDAKALNFLDTVSEAYRLKKWPREVGLEFLSKIIVATKESLDMNKSVENLLYFTNALLIMADNGIVPPAYNIELEDLNRRINENHSMFKDLFGDQQSREANFVSLSDYLRRNEELSIELRQLTADVENDLGIR